jgi:hypothetical protein
MTGSTNACKAGVYFFLTYYLFPREVAVSVDQPARMTKDGFVGRPPQSDQELIANGFDIRMDITPDAGGTGQLKILRHLPQKNPVNPAWFGRPSEAIIAFLLPLLTALAGLGLVRLLFPALV